MYAARQWTWFCNNRKRGIEHALTHKVLAGCMLHADIGAGSDKALTDARMTVFGMQAIASGPGCDAIVVSNDRDFLPLVGALRSAGCYTVVAGFPVGGSPDAGLHAASAGLLYLPRAEENPADLSGETSSDADATTSEDDRALSASDSDRGAGGQGAALPVAPAAKEIQVKTAFRGQCERLADMLQVCSSQLFKELHASLVRRAENAQFGEPVEFELYTGLLNPVNGKRAIKKHIIAGLKGNEPMAWTDDVKRKVRSRACCQNTATTTACPSTFSNVGTRSRHMCHAVQRCTEFRSFSSNCATTAYVAFALLAPSKRQRSCCCRAKNTCTASFLSVCAMHEPCFTGQGSARAMCEPLRMLCRQ